MTFTIPIKTVSEANCREHWAVKSRRVKGHRNAARLALCSLMNIGQWEAKEYPVKVKLTRIGKRMLDTDNLTSSLKATRDGIAEALGVDDGDLSKVVFDYAQEKGKQYEVRIEIQ